MKPYYITDDIGGIQYFAKLPMNKLHELAISNLVEMEEWNDCPGVARGFLPFLKRNPRFTAHGYVASPERRDSRINVEGVEKIGRLSEYEITDFANTFHGADDFQLDSQHARCWYD